MDDVTLVSLKNPEELIIKTETGEEIREKIKGVLSAFEYKIFELYLSGMSYREISVEVGKPMKAVDNALRRIKQKLTCNFK